MSTEWTSRDGVVVRDLLPAGPRRDWVKQGHCPDRDIYTLFSAHVRARPQHTAVVDAGGALSYVELDNHVRRVAAALAARDLGSRDVIGIQVPNGRDAVIAELAVAALGALALPYPAGRGRRDTASLLSRGRARAIITGNATLAAQVCEVRAELPHLRDVLVFGAAPPGCQSIVDLPADPHWAPAPVDPEWPARILVSSGSESEPKMVAYSHNAMAGGRANYLRAIHGGDPMRDLVLVPLASSYGSFGTPVTLAAHGGTLVLAPGPFDAATTLRMITEHRPTHVFGVPTMLRRLADTPPPPDEDLSSLRTIVSSADGLPDTTVHACRRRFGCAVINIYGSSDGVNCHTATPEVSAGTPDPAVADIRIIDGEICALGPMTPLCYIGAPELNTRYRLPGGWVRTGDRGAIDAHGRLHVLSRLRQVANRGGLTISLTEVERHVTAHPAVIDAACVAVPDPDLGERVCACVVARPGTAVTLPGITAFLERNRGLERKKLPERLLVLRELPVMATGKVCRRTLADLATHTNGG